MNQRTECTGTMTTGMVRSTVSSGNVHDSKGTATKRLVPTGTRKR